MKVLWRYNNGSLGFRTTEDLKLKSENDVKIKVMYNTVGIQDLRMSRSWDFYSKSGTAGYEMSGVITELGEAARKHGFYVGQRVTGTVARFCGKCVYCMNGQENNCLQPSLSSGTMSEYVVWDYSQLVPLKDEVPFSIGCLTEPVAVVYNACLKLNIQKDASICIFGADFNGLLMVQMAKNAGASKIIVVEEKKANQELAKKFGATKIINPLNEDFETELLRETDFTGFQRIAITSSNYDYVKTAISCAARGAIILFTVYFDFEKNIEINSVQFFTMNISLTSSFLYTREILQETPLVMQKLELEDLISQEYAYSDATSAFESETLNRFPRIGIRFFDETGFSSDVDSKTNPESD